MGDKGRVGEEGWIFCGAIKLRMLIEGYRMSGIEKNGVEEAILRALDKGIDDMENGRVVPHELARNIRRWCINWLTKSRIILEKR